MRFDVIFVQCGVLRNLKNQTQLFALLLTFFLFIGLSQMAQIHRTTCTKLMVTYTVSCFLLDIRVVVTVFLAPYWMHIHTWWFPMRQWLFQDG